jgi:hypothetical protein
MKFYRLTVARADTGAVLAFASVRVLMADGITLATIYNASGSLLANPLTADSNGAIGFAAADGTYVLAANSADGSYTMPQCTVDLYDWPAFATSLQQIVLGGAADLIATFGAVGDNVTDDLAAINRAIAALNSGAISTLRIPVGNFRHSAQPNPITRSGVAIIGAGARQSVFRPAGNFGSLWFKASDPTTAKISDIVLANISIDQGIASAPSAGTMLRMSRVDRFYAENIDIRNCYQGLLIEGGGDIHWTNSTITSAYTWSSVASGSCLVRLTNYAGTTEVPSEVEFTGINWKGPAPATTLNEPW